MKKAIIAIIISSVVFAGCLKSGATKCTFNDSNVTAPASEIADMQTYLTSQSITASQHSSGFFYKVTAVGTGTIINNLCATVTVKYKGKLTNGTVFDSTATGAVSSFQLGNTIAGFQKGLPLISKGGSITLYLPPSLAYGSATVGTIPANSKLIFDVQLIDVANQ